jgi:hypothetical protein
MNLTVVFIKILALIEQKGKWVIQKVSFSEKEQKHDIGL